MMNRSNTNQIVPNHATPAKLHLQTAIHEAGHAAAIYLGNRQKGLQPVFFQIAISRSPNPGRPRQAKVQGGRLLHFLTRSMDEATRGFSPEQKAGYLQAFDADVVNLMAGPLAEAHFIAMVDNEVIHPCLVDLPALAHYGGGADLAAINDYMSYYSDDADRRKQKLDALFIEAYRFVNDHAHWRAIVALSKTIVANTSGHLAYQEIAAVLDAPAARRAPLVANG